MVLFKNFILINVYLFLSFTLNLIQWIPLLILENIINIVIIILYIVPMFFVYTMIRTIYENQVKKSLYKVAMYAALLLSYIGMFAMIMIGMGYDKSTYIQDYKFEDKIFYVYQNNDLTYEVSIKDDKIPIRSLPIASFSKSPISLKQKENFIYAISEGQHTKIYNLKNKKENNEY